MVKWLLAASYFLHLAATVVWIGGLVVLVVLVWPEARSLLARQHADGTDRADADSSLVEFLDRLRKRFYPLTNLSLVILIVTGLFQMDQNPHYDGLLQLTNDWTRAILLKHVAVLGMLVIGVAMQWGVMPALERATILSRRGKDTPDFERLRRRERQLTVLNCALGIVVLVFTAIARSI